MATCSEIGAHDTFDEPLIKGLTGGDQVVGRRLYQNSTEFRSSAKIIIATNILPNIEATDHGIERHLEVLPFNKKFTGDLMDKGLMAKLLEEKEGILALLVQHAKTYFEQGEITPPEAVTKATDNYIKTGNSVKCFLNECTEETTDECTEETTDGNSNPTIPDTYQQYVDYCHQNGLKTVSSYNFSRLMKLNGKEQGKSGPGRYWKGLKLIGSPQNESQQPNDKKGKKPNTPK